MAILGEANLGRPAATFEPLLQPDTEILVDMAVNSTVKGPIIALAHSPKIRVCEKIIAPINGSNSWRDIELPWMKDGINLPI